MKIGLDIMGGDYAPDATIKGAIEALPAFDGEHKLVLIGDEKLIIEELQKNGHSAESFEIIHAPDVLSMSASPVKAIVAQPESSIAVGFTALKESRIDGFCSAGNSGAMMVGSLLRTGSIREDLRPCIVSTMPKLNGEESIILDVGANADCKPENLLDFAILGKVYAQTVLKKENPKIALINIGEEPEKGNQLTIATHKLLAENTNLNFIGNAESRELFDSEADVFVCSGFVGNIILKMAEKFYEIACHKGLENDSFFSRFNYEIYGGSPILGVNKAVVVGHGISSPTAIKNMILCTKKIAENHLPDQIKKAMYV